MATSMHGGAADVKNNDERRQISLEQSGLVILRFSNDDVELRLEEVKGKLEDYIKARTTNGK